ncbi:MAG TPA: class I SAM-dependent methyltransferase, partial [Ktedonobacterales bacterium]
AKARREVAMAHFDRNFPPLGGGGGGAPHWDDWDPTAAHGGITGHIPALGGAPPSPLTLGGSAQPFSSSGALSPAALAANARAAMEDYLTIEYDVDHPGFVEIYDELIVPQWSQPFGRLLLSAFLTQARNTGWQVLDVACGTGYPTIDLARFLGQDCDVAGLDPWEAAIRRAKDKARDEWLSNVTFVAASITQNNLPDGVFDTITCNLGLPSFADRLAALGGMARLLHPGGHLLLTTPLQTAMREFLDIYYLTLRDLKLTDYQHALRRVVESRPTVAGARSLIESAGFEVERAVTDQFVMRFPDPRAFLSSIVVQTTFMRAWRSIIPDVTMRRLIFNEVERRLAARAAASGGALQLTVPMVCLVARRL